MILSIPKVSKVRNSVGSTTILLLLLVTGQICLHSGFVARLNPLWVGLDGVTSVHCRPGTCIHSVPLADS